MDWFSEYYPYKVYFNKAGYLEEKDNPNNKEKEYTDEYKPVLSEFFAEKLYLSVKNLCLSSETRSYEDSSNAHEVYTAKTLSGKASFTHDDNTIISFFGTDREIKEFDIRLREDKKATGFVFDSSYIFDDTGIGNSGCFHNEFIIIWILLNACVFNEIARGVEKNIIDSIKIYIEIGDVDGIYKLDTFSPDRKYKILSDTGQISNKSNKDQFSNFKSTNSRSLYKNFEIFIDSKPINIIQKNSREELLKVEEEKLQNQNETEKNDFYKKIMCVNILNINRCLCIQVVCCIVITVKFLFF